MRLSEKTLWSSHFCKTNFKTSKRSVQYKSGLDYTKMLIINNTSYFSEEAAVIDNDEYFETLKNIDKIKKESKEFLDKYINHMKGIELLHQDEFKRRYQYSPLKYFHKKLEI